MTRPRIRQYDLGFVVGRLSEFAAEAGIARDRQEYVVVGHELVSRNALQQDGAALLRAAVRPPSTVVLPFAADRIFLKANARVFGLRHMPGRTASVQLRSSAGQSVFRECRARRMVGRYCQAIHGLGVPRLRSWDRRRGRWLIEDHVGGGSPVDADFERLVDRLPEFYRPTVRPRLVHRSPGKQAFLDRLGGLLREHAPSFPSLRPGDRWLVALCHNDLDDSNLLAHEEQTWIIDWENAAVVPLAAEFGRLFAKRPHLKDRLIAILERFGGDADVLPPAHQFALGAVFEAERIRLIRRFWIDDAIGSRGLSAAEAEVAHEQAVGSAFDAVASLGR